MHSGQVVGDSWATGTSFCRAKVLAVEPGAASKFKAELSLHCCELKKEIQKIP